MTAAAHPWRDARDHGPRVDIRWHFGGDAANVTWHGDDSVTISLDKTAGQAERRCTLQHELTHLRRGRPPIGVAAKRAEEARVRAEAARLLIPFDTLVEAARWTSSWHEMAEYCWVDYPTMRNRLATCTDEEAAVLREIDGERHP
ncbi:hypothetical protein EK0264_03545 [Epidermidibacterium keratini]|uniref:ImmA/IrrE family metallo-endopeptidase n=1 Tax=Epidermidibacterium keratini TaxID=1891644 RepID=A0A7L4YJH0_9ACTN|nr:hypothetical protein [Epidermidibacterium keratini]QHB99444.1 hypothetical protein EK0264_03545 [Epidermidibacterium keratini]